VIVSPHAGVAAVLASHGDRAGAERNRLLATHAKTVHSLTNLSIVTAGVLKGEPTLEAALSQAAASGVREVFVYPLFMSDGYFTTTVLPDRIRTAGFENSAHLLPPLGLDPHIADLVQADALETSLRTGLEPRASRLLVVGHGSKFGPASAQATQVVADSIARSGIFASVATAFLEEPPFLETELEGARDPTIVAGFFFGDGMHAGEDIPAAIDRTGAHAVYAGPVGRSARIPALIAAAVLAAAESRTR
jgi:sirohydrochlorin ferrochelatase